jgi:glycosyltransferase involved in cell wall biosynthesis
VSRRSLAIAFDRQIFRRQSRGGITRYFQELRAGLGGRPDLEVLEMGRGRWRHADVLHASFYNGRPYRRRSGQRLVSSLFDMTPERHPEHFFLPALRSPHANKAAWLEASDLILSISAASADDLSFFLPRLATPVRVIHLATAIDEVAPTPVPTLIGRRFWLVVGKRHAYKNGLTLLRALARLVRGGAGGHPAAELPLLVCAGGGTWRWIGSAGLDSRLMHVQATDEQLAWLYREAEAVLVPSMAEGFSLPLIEALACDTAVIASDLEVHREVAGAFATLLPALNAAAWSEALAGAGRCPLPRPRQQLGAERFESLRRHYAPQRLLLEHEQAYRGLKAAEAMATRAWITPSTSR